jgi:hypothetical protein
MRSIKVAAGFVVLLFCVSLIAENTGQKIVVTGTLSRAMGIGAETTGWMIQLDSETTIDGKPVHSVEIAFPKAKKLEELNNQLVKAKGTITHRHGVETGERTVLEVSSIKAAKAK